MNIYKLFRKFKSSTIAFNSFVLFMGNMLVNVFAYLYHLFVGRILGPNLYGELAALLSIIYIANVPSEVIRTVSMKFFTTFYANHNIEQANYLLRQTLKIIVVFSIIGLVILYPFFSYFSEFLHISKSTYFIWLYILIAFQLAGGLFAGALLAYHKFVVTTALLNILIISRLIIGIISSFYGVEAALIGNTISTAIGTLFFIIPLRFILKEKTEKSIYKKVDYIKYSLPTLLSLIGLTALYSFDVVMVKHFFDNYEAGIYSSLAVLGKVIFFASNSVGFVLFPVIAKNWEQGKKITREFVLSVLLVASISFIISFLYIFFPNIVVNLLFGAKFQNASRYVGSFGLFLAFFSVSSIIMNAYLAIGKTKVWIFFILASLTQFVGINFFHSNLQEVININIFVSVALVISLLIYYPYAIKKK